MQRASYPRTVIEAVDALTKRPGESYEDLIDRLKTNPIARRVKLADPADNTDIRRIKKLCEKDFRRLTRYREAWATLTEEGHTD